jgi:DNA-binding response OmpR family regulator
MNNTNFTLLYAEDDKLIRSGYINYFKTIFKNVYAAKDGQEAYDLYKQHNPDIILADINMPYMDGLELIEKIRENDKVVKIIILSAHIDKDKLLRAVKLMLVDYLEKPIKKRELESTLKSVIDELKKDIYQNDEIIKLGENIVWNATKRILSQNNHKIHLTMNETILLTILSSKTKNTYSIDELIDAFWQMEHNKDMSKESIRNIIKRIKTKLPKYCLENDYGIGYKLCIKNR